MDQNDLKIKLTNWNREITHAEKDHLYDFLEKILSKEMKFYNAFGIEMDRQKYLKALEGRTYDQADTVIDKIFISNQGDSAEVVAIVTAKGMNNQRPFAGVYRNERSWKMEADGNWRLVEWKNTVLS